MTQSRPDGSHSTWHDIGPISEYADDDNQGVVAKEHFIAGHVIAIFHVDGDWYGLDAMCSHQGGPIAGGTVRDGCVTCPWHGWQYELATGVQTINRQPLQRTYDVRVLAGRVQVRVDDERVESA